MTKRWLFIASGHWKAKAASSIASCRCVPWPLRSRANNAAQMACDTVNALSLSHTVVASSVGSPVAWLGCDADMPDTAWITASYTRPPA